MKKGNNRQAIEAELPAWGRVRRRQVAGGDPVVNRGNRHAEKACDFAGGQKFTGHGSVARLLVLLVLTDLRVFMGFIIMEISNLVNKNFTAFFIIQ
jgi:hypothetical protein